MRKQIQREFQDRPMVLPTCKWLSQESNPGLFLSQRYIFFLLFKVYPHPLAHLPFHLLLSIPLHKLLSWCTQNHGSSFQPPPFRGINISWLMPMPPLKDKVHESENHIMLINSIPRTQGRELPLLKCSSTSTRLLSQILILLDPLEDWNLPTTPTFLKQSPPLALVRPFYPCFPPASLIPTHKLNL